jgi:hypothetical protein
MLLEVWRWVRRRRGEGRKKEGGRRKMKEGRKKEGEIIEGRRKKEGGGRRKEGEGRAEQRGLSNLEKISEKKFQILK